MSKSSKIGQKLTTLFFLGCLLFNYPLLAIFADSGTIAGVPTLYLFIFVSWAALIGLTVSVVEGKK